MVEPGKAPFCGDYRKCNNAEGCDCCKEFEEWVAKKEACEKINRCSCQDCAFNSNAELCQQYIKYKKPNYSMEIEDRFYYDPIAGDD